MSKLVISMDNGVLLGALVDFPVPYDIKVVSVDLEDKYTADGAVLWKALDAERKMGAMRNLAEDDPFPLGTPYALPIAHRLRNDGLLDLALESFAAETDEGEAAQLQELAFINGYLTAHAEIRRLQFRLEEPYGPKDACGIRELLRSMVDWQRENYHLMYAAVNDGNLFDEEYAGGQS